MHMFCCMVLIDIVDVLLEADARVKEKNASGWTPLDEAISYGDRPTSKLPIQVCMDLLHHWS